MQRQAHFRTVSPQHPALQPWVDYYYFHTSTAGFDQRYIYYPHYGSALNVYLDGKRAKTWDMQFIDPAGGLKSSVEDMLLYLTAQLDPEAAGLPWLRRAQDSFDYSVRMPEGSLWTDNAMGWGWWHNLEVSGRPFLWHGGSTGGYNSFAGFDSERQRAVVVVGNLSSSHPQGRAAKRIPWAVRLGQELMGVGM